MALVELERFNSPIAAAEIARGRLASEGIETVAFDGGLASLGIGSLTPVRLMVDEDDLGLARRILDECESG